MLNVNARTDGIGLTCNVLQQPFGSFMYLKSRSLNGVFKVLLGDFWHKVALCPLIDEPSSESCL